MCLTMYFLVWILFVLVQDVLTFLKDLKLLIKALRLWLEIENHALSFMPILKMLLWDETGVYFW